MTPEESQALSDAVDEFAEHDVARGQLLHLIIAYLPGFGLPEPQPVEEAVPVELEAPLVPAEGEANAN